MVDPSYKRLLLRVKNDRGLDLSGYKQQFILRRLRSRFRTLGIEDIEAYTRILRHYPEEYEKLIEALAINVTEFFRDPTLFETISKKVLFELCEKKARLTVKNLRFFCAGGASGEEPYSLAITIRETLGDSLEDYTISIFSVDIDTDCIRKAKAGSYQARNLRNVPPEILDKYFTNKGDVYQLDSSIKKMVRTYHMDILTSKIPKYFDVIFCRNVLIYFSKEAHTDLFIKFHESLAPGGFLVLGRTETLLGAKTRLFDIYVGKEHIYRKCGK